jgi:hypothetical protein
MSNVTTGWQSQFKLHDGTSLVTLAEIFSASVPAASRGQFEQSHYLSDSKEFGASPLKEYKQY